MIWFEEHISPSVILRGIYNGYGQCGRNIIELMLIHGEDTYLVFQHNPTSLGYQDPNRDDILGKYASKVNKVKGLIDSRGLDDYLAALRK